MARTCAPCTVAASLDAISGDVIVPLATSMQGLESSSLFTADGAINVDALSVLADTLTTSQGTINRVAADIEALPAAHIGQLQDALDKAKPLVATLNDGVNAAAEVAPYLPQMLGANGQTRTYIIVAQNNSELRATGGFPGATGTLSVTDGKLELGEFQSIHTFGGAEGGAIPVSEEELSALRRVRVGEHPAAASPRRFADFPASGGHVRDLCGATPRHPIRRRDRPRPDLPAKPPLPHRRHHPARWHDHRPDECRAILLHDVYLRFDDPEMQGGRLLRRGG